MSDIVTERLQRLFEMARRPDGKRWTLKQVAEATGLSLSYVWRLRSGKAVNPTRLVLEKLASFFGVPVTYLVSTGPDSGSLVHPAGEQEIEQLLQAARDYSSAGNPTEAERAARIALDKSRDLGSSPLTARSLVTLARILARTHRLGEARDAVSAALNTLSGSPPGPEWIQAVLALSYIEYQEDHFARAYFHARQALAALEVGKGNRMLHYDTLFHVGTLARSVGRADEAVAYLDQARHMAEELGERYLAPVLMNLGLAALDADQADVALEYFKQALALYVRLRFPIWANRAQHNMGLAYERLGRWQEAIESLMKSLGSHEAFGDTDLIVYDHMELGWCYANTGQREEALRHAYTALALAQEHERAGYKARVHWHLGRVLGTLGDLDEAVAHYEQAIQLLEQLELEAELPKVQIEFGDLLVKKGDAGRAAELYRRAAVFVMRTPSLHKYLFVASPLEAHDTAVNLT